MKNRYLVISHDAESQCFYHDFVIADDEDGAEKMVTEVRDYCIGAEAIGIATLRTHLACLDAWTIGQIEKSWQDIVNQHVKVN